MKATNLATYNTKIDDIGANSTKTADAALSLTKSADETTTAEVALGQND